MNKILATFWVHLQINFDWNFLHQRTSFYSTSGSLYMISNLHWIAIKLFSTLLTCGINQLCRINRIIENENNMKNRYATSISFPSIFLFLLGFFLNSISFFNFSNSSFNIFLCVQSSWTKIKPRYLLFHHSYLFWKINIDVTLRSKNYLSIK